MYQTAIPTNEIDQYELKYENAFHNDDLEFSNKVRSFNIKSRHFSNEMIAFIIGLDP